MEHDNSHSVGNPAAFAGDTGNFDTEAAPSANTSFPNTSVRHSSLRALARQEENSLSDEPGLRRYSELNLEQLEMLEAELANQGLVPRSVSESFSIAQHAVHSAAILRWRAARAGYTTQLFDFRIDLPRYILTRAEEIAAQLDAPPRDEDLLARRTDSWGRERESRTQLLKQLEYLSALAEYLIADHGEASTNRYHRGLSVVLRALSTQTNSTNAELREGLEVTLPIAVSAFLQLLRAPDARSEKEERPGVPFATTKKPESASTD